MLFQCSKCGKFRKYGAWVDVPQKLLTQIQNVPITYILCPSCEEEEAFSQSLMSAGGGVVHEHHMEEVGSCKKDGCHCKKDKVHNSDKKLCLCGSH